MSNTRARAGEIATAPAADAPSFMVTLIHGRRYDLAGQIFEHAETTAVTEDVARQLAGATDHVARDDREVGRYGVSRWNLLIIGPDGSAIIPDGVEPPRPPRGRPAKLDHQDGLTRNNTRERGKIS